MKKKLSFVIPVMNEEMSLRELVQRISTVLDQEQLRPSDYEIIMIDDGSTDGSREVIRDIVRSKTNVHGIFFRRNYGKSSALAVGFRKACGDIIMTMDADLQDDPMEIPRFLSKMDEGFDMVSGWKKVRNDPFEKVFMSRIFNKIVSKLTDVDLHDFNCGFKAYRSWCLKRVFVHGNYHRFIPVLIDREGGKITEIPVNHNRREFGVSKYGINRYIHGIIDLFGILLITRFYDRPMYFFGLGGFPLIFLGGLICAYLLGGHLLWMMSDSLGQQLFNRPLLTLAISMIGFGLNIIFVGALSEIILQMNKHEGRKGFYTVAEEISPTCGDSKSDKVA